MTWLFVDIKIALVLLAWILCCYGLGNIIFKILNRFNVDFFVDSYALRLFSLLLMGVMFLCFITQTLHLFMPISPIVSFLLLLVGNIAFIVCFKNCEFKNWRVALSAIVSFILVSILSFLNDSLYDSINYHIQIVSYIQNEPLIFGLGNIHSRLGYNGIIYNFYALSDVSQIFSGIRSFIGNEIIFFAFLFSAIYALLAREVQRFHTLFLITSLIPFGWILKWGEFRGLYCEGIGAVLGIFIYTSLLYTLESKTKQNATLALLLIFSIFAAMIKIANTALIIGIVFIFIALNAKNFYKKQWYKNYIYLFFGLLVFIIPWALKGIATSGMIAYPANIFHFSSLPFSISETTRQSEICWIMSWARDPGKDCQEVLSNLDWLKNWLGGKIYYFKAYFKYFVYAIFANLALFVILNLIKRNITKDFVLPFCGIVCGVLFWFLSGPDPRFGMAYIIPLVALFYSYNLRFIQHLTNEKLKYLGYFAFILSLLPFWFLQRPMYLILLLLWLVIPSYPQKRFYFFYCALLFLLMFVSIPNLYRKDLKQITSLPKISNIFATKKITDFGVEVYVRYDEKQENTQVYDYEPRPMTPYFNPNIKQGIFLGRKAYIDTKKQ